MCAAEVLTIMSAHITPLRDAAEVTRFGGKAAGLPLWRLLGGYGKPITCYASSGYYRRDQNLDQFAEMSFCLLEADLDHGTRIPPYSGVRAGCGGG